MRSKHGHRWKLAATTLALTLALVGCGGGDTPEELSLSLSDASETLPFADVADNGCIATAIIDEVGFDQLQTEAVTAQRLALEPTLITDVLETHHSDALDEALKSCLETDAMFRGALAPFAPGGIQCDDPFTRDIATVENHLSEHMKEGQAELAIDDTPDMRDLFRPCLTEEDFAEMFGLDTRGELAAALNVELEERVDGTLRTNCGGKSIVAEFGVEDLAEMGLTTETPNLNITRLDIPAETRSAMLKAIAECVSYDDVLRAEVLKHDPMLADCLAEELSAGYQQDRIWFNLGERSREVVLDRMIDRAGGECLEMQIETVFGEFNLLKMQSVNALAFVFTLEDDELASTRSSMRCAAYGAYLDVGQEALDAELETFLSGAEDDPATWRALNVVLVALMENKHECLGDWLLLSDNLYLAGFRNETLECVHKRFEGQIAGMAALYVRYVTDPDVTWTEIIQMETFLEDLYDQTELCMDVSEQRTYDKLRNWVDSFEAGLEAQDGTASA